jgi:hypothetical protein
MFTALSIWSDENSSGVLTSKIFGFYVDFFFSEKTTAEIVSTLLDFCPLQEKTTKLRTKSIKF